MATLCSWEGVQGKGFAFTMGPEDDGKMCEKWNSLSTTKLKEVIDSARDDFKWQSTLAAIALKNKPFKEWLYSRQMRAEMRACHSVCAGVHAETYDVAAKRQDGACLSRTPGHPCYKNRPLHTSQEMA